MTAFTIDLSDEQLHRLKEAADRFGIAPAELVLASIEDLLSLPDDELEQEMEYILEKNAELFRRLA